MHRPLVTMTFVLLATLIQPRSANAGLWAWLEQWSGPGPFKGWTFLVTACVQDGTPKASPISRNDLFHTRLESRVAQIDPASIGLTHSELLRRLLANPQLYSVATASEGPDPVIASIASEEPPTALALTRVRTTYQQVDTRQGPGHQDKRVLCGYVDQGFFTANANNGFPDVKAHLTDIGPSARVHDGVDVGGGFGWIRFTAKPVGGAIRKTQATLTPIRLILRPILIGMPEELRKKWMGFLNIYWKETYVIGQLTGADFGAPENPYRVNGELVRSFGLNFDVTALLPAAWGLR